MKLMRKPMEALGKVHQFGLLHGDISPANLMLAENGEVYLIDFGAACAIEGNDDARTIEPFFNRYFSPPEMLNGGKRDTYSDIYSLCAAMVFLMTGNTVPTALDREKNDTIPSTIRKLKLPYRQKQTLLHGLELKVKQRTENIPLLLHGFYKIPLPKSEEEKKRYKHRMTWLGIGFAALYVGTILFTGLRMDEYIPSAHQAISDKNADLAIELAEDCADGIYLGGERAANFWLQWAAKYGTDQQLFKIAQTYYQNDLDYLLENKPVALAYMEQCCAHGYPDAMNWLAVEYATGEHIGKDLQKALELLQQACDLEYSEAYVNLGILKKQEFQQPETAFSLFLKAAELGNAKGMSLVAYAYHDGIGVKQDLDEATKWMLMASSAGDPEAMGEIGGYYLYNTFISPNGNELKDVGTGMLLLDQAIWDGSASAHYYWSGVLSGKYDISGSYYAESMDIPNTEKAFAHMLKSAEMGYYPAMNEVADLYEQGIGVEINMDQAAFWRKQSMESQR